MDITSILFTVLECFIPILFALGLHCFSILFKYFLNDAKKLALDKCANDLEFKACNDYFNLVNKGLIYSLFVAYFASIIAIFINIFSLEILF